MRRHFPDFLSAYFNHAVDGFAPDVFHTWTGISLVSGALERRVWLKVDKAIYHPNTFIFLVGFPGTGKSTALTRGTSLLQAMKTLDAPNFKIMSGLMTQAGLITQMNIFSSYQLEGKPDIIPYSSGYYFASEASDSALQNLHGDFNATITAMYDCADTYEKTLKGENYVIPNPSLCVLAATTFDFLKTLVNENSVMGGLASRLTYIVSHERKRPKKTWGDDHGPELDPRERELLTEDLCTISKLVGPFQTKRAAIELFREWDKKYHDEFLALESERMQSIMSRKPTMLKKLCMILSAASSNELIIRAEHMEKAIELTDEATKSDAKIISSAVIGNKNTQEAINQFIMQTVRDAGMRITQQTMRMKFMSYGGDVGKLDPTLKLLSEAGAIEYDPSGGHGTDIKLLINPDTKL